MIQKLERDPFYLDHNLEPLMVYRGTSLIKNCHSLGPYSRTIPRALQWSWGGGSFL